MVTEITKILVASVNFSIDDVRHPSIRVTLMIKPLFDELDIYQNINVNILVSII